MDRLWAPWRAHYVMRPKSRADLDPPRPACFLCAAIEVDPRQDRERLLVWRREETVVMLNRFPYNNGHLLVAPNLHEGSLTRLEGPALHQPLETIQVCLEALEQLMSPHGFNVGLNLGEAAGAGLPGHLHWHVVPRWSGDNNFMPVIADAKVIIESLESFFDRFRPILAEVAARRGLVIDPPVTDAVRSEFRSHDDRPGSPRRS